MHINEMIALREITAKQDLKKMQDFLMTMFRGGLLIEQIQWS